MFSTTYLMQMLYLLPGLIIAISFHEFAHAWVSDRLGDPLPRAQGRVTISPMAHVDPIGILMLLILRFGFGKPVQVDPTYYKNRRRGELMVSLAGVTMNFLVALLLTAVMILLSKYTSVLRNEAIYSIFYLAVMININLMVFNLIPIPPLDGYKVVKTLFIGGKTVNFLWKVEQYGFFILIGLLIVNSYVYPWLGVLNGWVQNLIALLLGWMV